MENENTTKIETTTDTSSQMMQNISKINNIYHTLRRIDDNTNTIKNWVTFFGIVTITGIVAGVILAVYLTSGIK